jgi:competence protein ComEA
MNQRLALSAAAVVLAAGAAVFRPWHPSAPALAGADSVAVAAARSSPPGAGPSAAGVLPAGVLPSAGVLPAASRGSERAVVYVAGEVLRPGVYALPVSARAVDALRAAGGPGPGADLVAVNLAERLTDGEEIVVQPKGAPALLTASGTAGPLQAGRRRSSGRSARHRRGSRSRKAAPAETVDLNRADAATLEELPGVGPALAERIVAFRQLNGPFASLDELLDVNGMSDSRLEEIAPYAILR